ncbi:MAG: helix-turn-helix domain-containing protein [Burkholderiaceae bacterium]
MAGSAALHVSLAAVPGSLSSPITGLYELLTSFPVVADFYDDVPAISPFDVEIVGRSRKTLTAPSGLPIRIQRSIAEIEHSDIVILPAMAVEPGKHRQHPELVRWLRGMHERGAVLCSACTGLVLLAETGLLEGRRATTHWSFAPAMQQAFPGIEMCVHEVLVTAGEREEFVMAGGAASWQDLALYLIERFVGVAASRAIARFELLERHASGQTPYLPFSPRTGHGDALVLESQRWLDENFPLANPVAAMTRLSGLSLRSFERRFRKATGYSPMNYVQHTRVEEAKRRLERDDASIDRISWEVGYEEAAAFRRVFKRIVRMTPGIYRRKFAPLRR